MKDKRLKSIRIIPKELYVKRDADKQLKSIISDMGSPGYILVARQMGKTNLLLNAKRELEDEENIYVYVDLSNLFENSRDCFRNIIDTALESRKEVFGAFQNKIYRNREIQKLPPHKEHERELKILLEATRGKVVIFLDEIGSLIKVPFSDEIFSLIRSIYFSRVNFKEFERLTYILAGVAEPYELIKNKNISPFNIGEKIYLDDFNYKEFMTFLKQADLSFSNVVAERVFYWASGNPRITWDLCSKLEDVYMEGTRLTVETVDDAVKKLYFTTVNTAPVDHIRNEVRNDKEIRDAVILLKNNKGSTLSNDVKNKLYLTGIIKSGYQSQEAVLKNKVIDKSLSQEWLICTEHYPLSQAQLRLWWLSQLNVASTLYNMSFAFVMEGKLDYRAFVKAFHEIVQRQEILRTTIINVDGKPWQKIHVKMDFSIDKINFKNEENTQSRAYALAREAAAKPFDMVEGPLFRILLFELSDNHYIFLFVVHNIIFDNFSINILLEELSHIYRFPVDDLNGSLKPLDHQYRNFAEQQNILLESKALDIHRDYWHSKLSGDTPVINLPWDFPRPQERSLNAHLANFSLDVKTLKNLHEFCREEKIDLFVVILTILKILFYRYSGQEEILLGIPMSGRNNTTLKTQIGLYENKLVLRDLIKGDISFVDLLRQVIQTEQEAREHKEYPFEKLLHDLEVPISSSHSPLFNVKVEFKNIEEINILFKNLRLSTFNINLKNNDYDLTFTFIEMRDLLVVKIEYSNDLFLEPTIERIGKHFIKLITNIVSDIKERNKPIYDLNLLSQKETEEILLEFNNTAVDYPRDKTIINIFEEQVIKTPDNVSIVFKEVYLSYKALNRLVNQIGYFLRDTFSIKQDNPVGLLIKISEWAIVGLLSVLKAGGAYVPMDVYWPETLIINMVQDLNCKLVLVDEYFDGFKSSYRFKKESGSIYQDDRFVNIRDILRNSTHDCNPHPANQSQNLAYIIYTSSTTGHSLGVMIEHHSVVNLIQAVRNRIFRHSDSFLHISLMTSLSFDFSVLEIFSALLQGHPLYIATQVIKDDIYALGSYLEKHSIDIINITHSIFSRLVDVWVLKSSRCTLKHIVLGGEEISVRGVKLFYSKLEHQEVSISYTYGTTECTVISVLKSINRESINLSGNIPIGVPLDNTEVYILGDYHQLLPIGAAGEICISGEGVNRGYVNIPELSANRMIPHPFKKRELLYRTGDLGRWILNNNIEYLGKIDQQVKFRFEPGEIEPLEANIKEKKKKILILSANPGSASRLRLDEEVREIEEGLRRAKYRSQFEIHSIWAVRFRDLRRALLEYMPQIVHFSGHGKANTLLVEDELGMSVRIPQNALSGLFKLFSTHVECVILSACYSEPQADAISKHIDYVIGMRKDIKDKAAIEFAVGFYDALGAGRSVEEAFEFGCNAILQVYPDLPEHLIPVLKNRNG